MNQRSKSERNFRLEFQHNELLNKIERSKPLLATIYDKIKRKQQLLYDRIYREKRTVTEYKNIAKDFKKLYQQSIQAIQKGKLVDKFENQRSNFLRTRGKKIGVNNQKNKSVYQQYRQRMQKIKTQNQEQRNPEIQEIRKQNKKLKDKLVQDIDKLRLIRQKSQKSLRKTKSSQLLYKNSAFRTNYEQIKRKLADRNRQKMQKIK